MCGESYIGPDDISASTYSWFQGYGASDPGCDKTVGDTVSDGWLGAQGTVYRYGSLYQNGLCAYGWAYSQGSVYNFGNGVRCSAIAGQYQVLAQSKWWASDSGNYAADSQWSPVYTR